MPCPLCGYDAPERRCRHCDLNPRDEVLSATRSRAWQGFVDGLRAVPMGLWLLARTRGVKRFMLPPLIMTLLVFGLFFGWLWGWITGISDGILSQDFSQLGLQDGWLLERLRWIADRTVVIWIAKAGTLILFMVTSFVVVLWFFSLAYEAISGPFLDEIQGRFEERWFGKNPRNAIQRPTDIPVRSCVITSSVAGAAAAGFAIYGTFAVGWTAWVAFALVPLCFVIAGLAQREYGIWLWWVIRIESKTLWVSVKAATLAGMLLLMFIWLKFVPVVGLFLFAALAGFTTAISLLDIPFSRREWSMTKRMQFMVHHFLPVVAYGIVASLLFIIPVIGPVLMVPAASIGGLWLLCRLDKNSLRPRELRFDAPAAPSAEQAAPADPAT